MVTWKITIDQRTLSFADLEQRQFTSNRKLLSDAIEDALNQADLSLNVAGDYQITATKESDV